MQCCGCRCYCGCPPGASLPSPPPLSPLLPPAGGQLKAVFTISLLRSVATLTATPLNYIYAVGSMGGFSPPGLSYHMGAPPAPPAPLLF